MTTAANGRRPAPGLCPVVVATRLLVALAIHLWIGALFTYALFGAS